MNTQLTLSEGMTRSRLSWLELWVRYYSITGEMDPDQVRLAVEDDAVIERREHNLIAQALNDYFTGIGEDHPVAYR
jgi:hypothetical protein